MTAPGPRPALMIAVLTAALAAALGCQPAGPPVPLPPGASVLRLAMSDDVPTLDPAAGYDTASWQFEQMIFDTLARYTDTGVELEPDLALDWSVSPDARVLTFHLRRDARFSNGRGVTSADFEYSIERVLKPATRSKGAEYYRGLAGAADFIAARASRVAGIETPDPYTIIFRLRDPDPIFIHKLAMPFASAVPREVAERWGEDFSRHVIGSGPFTLDQWIGGQRLVLMKNHDYFVRDEPRLDAIVELVGVDQQLEWLKFEAGEADVSAIPPAQFVYVMKTPRLGALTIHNVTVSTNYLGMNCQMPPFTDVRVRRAFNYAVDKRKLLALLNGRGVVARGVLPPNMPGYNPSLTGYEYDQAKARRLLEEAGVPHDFQPELWLRSDPTQLLLGQSIQQDLALVGIHLVLKPIAWGPLLEAVRQPRTVPLFMLGWEADFPDPENFLDVLLSRKQWGSNNDTFYFNPEVDALLARAKPLTDLSERYALYRKAEEIVVADAPWVFLYHPVSYVIRQPWVHGYTLNPMRPTRFERVWVSPHSQ